MYHVVKEILYVRENEKAPNPKKKAKKNLNLLKNKNSFIYF